MADPRPLLRAINPVEAEIVCDALRSAGIKCGVADISNATDPLAWMGVGRGNLETNELTVFVDVSDLDRAEDVLAAFDETSDDSD